jgi:hypothetical protein
MGGFGSGRWGWHRKASTVESCLDLDLGVFTRRGRTPAPGTAGVLRWLKDGVETSTVGYRVEQGPVVRLRYTALFGRSNEPDAAVEMPIKLVAADMPQGGVKWWGRCPLAVGSVPCRREVAFLYLPPGERYFGCRVCHRLVYASAQSWDRRVQALISDPERFLAHEARIKEISFHDLLWMLKGLQREEDRLDRWTRRLNRRAGTWPRNDVTFNPAATPTRSSP